MMSVCNHARQSPSHCMLSYCMCLINTCCSACQRPGHTTEIQLPLLMQPLCCPLPDPQFSDNKYCMFCWLRVCFSCSDRQGAWQLLVEESCVGLTQLRTGTHIEGCTESRGFQISADHRLTQFVAAVRPASLLSSSSLPSRLAALCSLRPCNKWRKAK